MRIKDMEESSKRIIPDDVRSVVVDMLGNDLRGTRGIYYVMYRMEQMKLDLADWPEVQPWFDDRKDMMVRDLLKNLASTDEGAADAAAFTLKRMRSIGLAWPELDAIERSMRASGDLDEDRDDPNRDDDDRHERMMERMRDDVYEVMDAMTNTTAKTGRNRFRTASDAMNDLMGNDIGRGMLEDAMREDRHWIIANLVNAFFIDDNGALQGLIDLLEESPANWPELRNLPHSVKHLVEVEFNNMLADAGLADSMDAVHSMASTGLWDADDLMREVRQVYSADPQTWKPSWERGSRSIRRDLSSLPHIGATEDQISRMIDGNKDALVRAMLVDIKNGRTEDAAMLISDLMARGKDWTELAAMRRSIDADRKKPALSEDLGNLGKLGVGQLINVLKQSGYSGGRRYGSNIGGIGTKFARQSSIGSTSEISEPIAVKSGMKGLRKAYKDHPDAAAFAVYIGGHPVMFGTADQHQLGGSSREGRIAYDLTPYSEVIERLRAGEPRRQRLTTIRIGADEYGGRSTRRYAGDMISTGELTTVMDLIQAVGQDTGQPVTMRLVMDDKAATAKRRSRQEIKDQLQKSAKDIRIRLAVYKNSMRPTAKTIEDFIRLSLEKRGSTVRFANGTYRLSTSGYENMKIEDLLRGKQFKASYGSVDPGKYDSVDITYAFNPRENQLSPIKASWVDRGPDGNSYNQTEVIVDPAAYLSSELGRGYQDKNVALPAVLRMVKDKQTNRAATALDSLERLGMDWPEIGVIRKSLAAEPR